MGLQEYKKKRNKKATPEPFSGKASEKNPIFVVQEHHASHLHYDFRLEAFGTLKSWAVPKGPPLIPGEKRLAVEVEDHPIDYAKFHGRIPKGEYGAGLVKIWDKGVWIPPQHLREELKRGHIEFELEGKRLKGSWLLQRTKNKSGKKNQWLLIKRHDRKDARSANALKTVNKKTKADPWPQDIKPQLATLSVQIPSGSEWIYETKYDGYRTLTYIKNKEVVCLTRNGLDWTDRYPNVVKELANLKDITAILDGEIVALDSQGISSFSELQRNLKAKSGDLIYWVFDLLYINGNDLRSLSLQKRKEELKTLLTDLDSDSIRFSEHTRVDGKEFFTEVCQKGGEGVVAKDRNLPYREGRSQQWLKIKCSLRQEFIILGYTDPEGSRKSFGALLMGAYEGGKLRYVGRVGTGFDARTLADVFKKLNNIESRKNPIQVDTPLSDANVHWVKPILVAEVEFKTWTADRILRQASFKGLREDKKANDVEIEIAKPIEGKRSKKSTEFQISHPGRVLYPKSKVTKLDVAQYFKSISPWFLQYSSNRPLSLLRCHDGVGESCFFQKHLDITSYPSLSEAKARNQQILFLKDQRGLLDLVQLGVLEFHTWQCHTSNLEAPDQIVFDLDPDTAVSWNQVKETAFRIKDLLSRLHLKSFVKTTGGKGLHIHLPILPKHSWEDCKAFAKSVCQQLESLHPELYVTQMSKKKRNGKIFLDYLRNGFGATAIAPFSMRAREEPTVAVPIAWTELEDAKQFLQFNHKDVLLRLAQQKSDPWKESLKLRQIIKILDQAKTSRK